MKRGARRLPPVGGRIGFLVRRSAAIRGALLGLFDGLLDAASEGVHAMHSKVFYVNPHS